MAKFHIPKCTDCEMKSCYINRYASSSWKYVLEKVKTTSTYKKSRVIFREGEPVTGIYFIYNGKVKIYNTGPKGRTTIVRLAKPGDIFGHRGFGKQMVYPISAAALEDSVISYFPFKDFSESLYHNPDLMYNLLFFYADELKRAEYKMRSLMMMNVKQKTVEALLYMRNVYGITRRNNLDVIDVVMSRKDLADLAGASTREILRALAELKKDGIITLEGKDIAIIDNRQIVDLMKGFENLFLQ